MKKIFSFTLVLLVFFMTNLPIFADNVNSMQNNNPKIIVCNENSTEEICKSIKIIARKE